MNNQMTIHSVRKELRASMLTVAEQLHEELWNDYDPDEIHETVEFNFKFNAKTIDDILDAFRSILVIDVDRIDERKITAWRHQSDDFSATSGFYLVHEQGELIGNLSVYFDWEGTRVPRLEWAIMDMLVYAECRLLALDQGKVSVYVSKVLKGDDGNAVASRIDKESA